MQYGRAYGDFPSAPRSAKKERGVIMHVYRVPPQPDYALSSLIHRLVAAHPVALQVDVRVCPATRGDTPHLGNEANMTTRETQHRDRYAAISRGL